MSGEVFTAEELWMLYGLAGAEAARREHAELETFTDCAAGPWKVLRAKLRIEIEGRIAGAITGDTPDG